MSAPVDVLGLLDAAIVGVVNDPIRERRGHRENLIEIRAAVAELIEAAEYMTQYASSYSALTYSPTACAEANDRLRAALARCKGGAA